MNSLQRITAAVFKSSILWGGLAAAAFFALSINVWPNRFVHRYTMGNPIETVEVVCFCVGLASLALKAFDLVQQGQRFGRNLFGPCPDGGQELAECDGLLATLRALPEASQNDYLVRRLLGGLEHVWRHRSPEGLEQRLKRLSEIDADRAYADQGLLRLIVWAIPILGFLGTVVGITMALTSLNPEALEKSMVEVTQGLGVKFDTTALALTLSIVLMFFHYLVDRAENRLLERVDCQAESELLGRFRETARATGGEGAFPRRLAEQLLQATEALVERQAELWQRTIDAAHERWSSLTERSGQQLQDALAVALTESLQAHAKQLGAVEQSAAQENYRHWEQVQQALVAASQNLAALEAGLGQQGEMLARAVEAAGEVTKLEDALNHNLAALAGSQGFEQTLLGLAAATNLLVSRLGNLPTEGHTIRLEAARRASQAA